MKPLSPKQLANKYETYKKRVIRCGNIPDNYEQWLEWELKAKAL